MIRGVNYRDSWDPVEIAGVLGRDREVVAFDGHGHGFPAGVPPSSPSEPFSASVSRADRSTDLFDNVMDERCQPFYDEMAIDLQMFVDQRTTQGDQS